MPTVLTSVRRDRGGAGFWLTLEEEGEGRRGKGFAVAYSFVHGLRTRRARCQVAAGRSRQDAVQAVHGLEVEPRDVTPYALGLLLHAPAPAALVEASLRDGLGGALTLGVLRASHVVIAGVPGHHLTEQISCDAVAGGGQELPRHTRQDGYEFVTSIAEVTLAELGQVAARLRGAAGRSDSWLCAEFPGAAGAMTVVRARALPGRAWSWASWHL